MISKYKNVGVLWSGGLDSTYLIYWFLQNFPNVKIHAGYSQIENNPEKTKMELKAIENLAPIFVQLFPNRFHYRGIIQKTCVELTGGNETFKQLPIWLMTLFHFPETIDHLALGYVLNDDAISYIEDIKKAWKSLSFLLQKQPKLIFPLTKINKEYMVRFLPSELKDWVAWCEYPKELPDGKFLICKDRCPACKRTPIGINKISVTCDYIDAIKSDILGKQAELLEYNI